MHHILAQTLSPKPAVAPTQPQSTYQTAGSDGPSDTSFSDVFDATDAQQSRQDTRQDSANAATETPGQDPDAKTESDGQDDAPRSADTSGEIEADFEHLADPESALSPETKPRTSPSPLESTLQSRNAVPVAETAAPTDKRVVAAATTPALQRTPSQDAISTAETPSPEEQLFPKTAERRQDTKLATPETAPRTAAPVTAAAVPIQNSATAKVRPPVSGSVQAVPEPTDAETNAIRGEGQNPAPHSRDPSSAPVQAAMAQLSASHPAMRRKGPTVDADAPSAQAAPKVQMAKMAPNAATIQPAALLQVTETNRTPVSAEVEPGPTSRSDSIGTSATSQPQPLPTRVEVPQHIARQIAEAFQQMPGRQVEITLSPQELGRVRLGVSTSEGHIVVTIFAERPETSDLMRRHITTLEQAFQDLGYSGIDFSFGQGDGTQDKADGDTSGSNSDPNLTSEDADAGIPAIHLATAPITGVDIRL